MGNFCCNEITERHNENMLAEECTKTPSRKSLIRPPPDSSNLFTVIEVVGDDTSQSSFRCSANKIIT